MYMKILLQLAALLITSLTFAQVGIGTTTPNTSAMLDINSTTKGLLVPRMTLIEKNAIVTPANGLLIYQTDGVSGFWYYDGTSWQPFGADLDWTVSGTDMYNANTGNVGVGNVAPTAKFHVTGTTVPSTSGTTTLYTNDFSTGGVTNTLNAGNVCTTTPNIWHVSATSSNASCTTCTGNRAYIQYSSSCAQDQTITEGNFTPTTTSINISFNYGYNYFSGDSFTVTLYNETTTTVVATLLNLTADVLDASYLGTQTVVAGNNYSLKFQYIGDNDWGAAVDDVLITENTTPTAGSYMFRLEDGQQQDGYVLTSDANGNATWKSSSGTPPGSSDDDWLASGTITNTGLVYHAGTAVVGKTTISAGLTFQAADGTAASGTQVGLGSIEVVEDDSAEFMFNYLISPLTTNTIDIGSTTKRWRDIYLTNAPNVTSDMTLKTKIKKLNYGLSDILKLKTISYQWKDEQYGETIVPKKLKGTHIGFSAQQLLTVLPEVVTTHTWKVTDENQPNTFNRIKNKKLSVRYSEIIPVTVKAIQEQQEQIEVLKISIEKLQKQNKLLMSLLQK